MERYLLSVMCFARHVIPRLAQRAEGPHISRGDYAPAPEA